MPTKHFDVAVIGSGIVGLAFAWQAAKRGKSVIIFERSRAAEGATIRNFGMIWPIGQRPGADYDRALRSLESWKTVSREAGIWLDNCGSLHLAYHEPEDAVIREFAARAPDLGVPCEYWPASRVSTTYPAVKPDGLRGALYSSTEHVVDPREVPEKLIAWLVKNFTVTYQPSTTIVNIEMPNLRAASGEAWSASQVFVCSGSDFETLFPLEYHATGLRRCKLHMMATGIQPRGWRIGVHIAGGLTLGHYPAFQICDTLAEYHNWVQEEYAEYLPFGIHVMASQNRLGQVIIGDSHEYDADISIFQQAIIDQLILQYFDQMIELPDRNIERRWTGIYAKHPTGQVVFPEPQPNCTIVSGVGGAGMTLSFGYAEEWWNAHD
jgi:D-hydroxyproline dehydrogenase subunit beta